MLNWWQVPLIYRCRDGRDYLVRNYVQECHEMGSYPEIMIDFNSHTTSTWEGVLTQCIDTNTICTQGMRRYGELYKMIRWEVIKYEWGQTT